MRDREAGFTLIELLITMAVISILAVIALPSFFSESRKTRARSEVQPMFNDLRIRLEQYLQENGHYPVVAGELALYPGAPDGAKHAIDVAANPLPVTWSSIKVRVSGSNQVYCAYTWSTGLARVDPVAATSVVTDAAPSGFGFTTPTTDWYYLLAKCDMDGDGTTFSWYFSSSVEPTFVPLNEGR